jgi:hypothetical protein
MAGSPTGLSRVVQVPMLSADVCRERHGTCTLDSEILFAGWDDHAVNRKDVNSYVVINGEEPLS